MNKSIAFRGLAAFSCALVANIAFSQQPPAQQAPAAKKAANLVYEVVDVQGKVSVSPTGTDPKAKDGWTPIKIGDQLSAGQQVRVSPVRSKVKLVARPADPPTVMLIDRGSLVNISELTIENGAAKSRIQLNYGQIKAGVAEGSVRSDMQIESPVATLSKRGTDIFGFEYINGQYRMFLTDQGRGLIQAIQTQATAFGSQRMLQSRFVTPGQFVTHQLLSAIDNMQFDRTVNVNDVFGLGGADQLFNMLNDRGFGLFLNPTGNVAGVLKDQGADGQIGTEETKEEPVIPTFLSGNIRPSIQAGNFGIGQGNLPGLGKSKFKSHGIRKMIKAGRRR